ncbi:MULTISPECIES: OmpH family outer membrane protein [Hyphomonas]|jgi:outer membrane protein|uniref:Outer membrane chaperone Skp n=1 Tax=Hyphomonas jannaschiana VP2 TaxID=1280952 RepID=A0A059F8T2_9PROT|nr:OmpH family outer membrane protein [Hyphomonas jannaschiana]KCZ87002.1 outer membrane chaperone Skp [Hyphomonas jannaschiana VP2]
MSHLKKLLFAFALLIGSASFTVPTAAAQGSNVIAIDEVKILRESKAGKDMATKLNNIETQMNNELTPERTSLQTQGKTLDGKLQGKSREQVNADAALVSELNAYQAKANAFAAKAQKASQEFSLTERVALATFNKALEPVLLQVIQEKNAQLVVSKSSVVYSADSIDATALVIQKLDAASPTLTVTRQKIPDQPANPQ